jgi:hypothetical protein
MVRVPVMEVRIMRMAVPHCRVLVLVAMRLVPVPAGRMLVPVMLVVHVLVRVCHALVDVLMLVALRHVQPHAGRHQRAGNPECGGR